MSDAAAADRHQRHEGTFADHEKRLGVVEEESLVARLWRTGNGDPHRGAEHRIHTLEEEALMKSDLKALVLEAVKAHNSTLRAQLQAWGPYLLVVGGAIIYIATGQHPPQVTP